SRRRRTADCRPVCWTTDSRRGTWRSEHSWTAILLQSKMKGLSRRGLGRTQYPWRECFLPQRISLHVGRGAAPLPARCRRLDLRLEIGQRRALVTLRSRLGSALSYVCASLRPG